MTCNMQCTTGWSIWLNNWVGLTLIYEAPSSCPVSLPLQPTSHQPKQNQAEGGTANIKVHPTQSSDQMNPYVDVIGELNGVGLCCRLHPTYFGQCPSVQEYPNYKTCSLSKMRIDIRSNIRIL